MSIEEIKYTEEDLNNHYAIGAVVFDDKGRVLVQDHIKFNLWTIPIGKAALFEAPKQKMKEELMEECNIEVNSLEELDRAKKTVKRNEKIIEMDLILYIVKSWQGEVKNMEPHKHRQVEFMEIEELKYKINERKENPWITQMFLRWHELR